MRKPTSSSALAILCLSVLLVTCGCAFRKHPKTAPIKQIEQSVSKSIKDYFIEEPSETIIEKLDNLTDEQLYSNEIINYAIQNKNQKVLIYLLEERGISSFSYNEKSREELDRNALLNKYIATYQKHAILGITEAIKTENTVQAWEKILSKLKINPDSCFSVFETIIDLHYFAITLSGTQVEITETDLLNSFVNMTNTMICKSLRSSLPIAFKNSWLQSELKLQYYRKFESSKIIELLRNIGNFQDLSIDAISKVGIFRIDPRMLVLASLPFGEDFEKKKLWISLLEPFINNDPLFYHVPYLCKGYEPSCDSKNREGIGQVLFWMDRVQEPSFIQDHRQALEEAGNE